MPSDKVCKSAGHEQCKCEKSYSHKLDQCLIRSRRVFRYVATRIAVFVSSILSKQCAAQIREENEIARRIEAAVESVPEFEISFSSDAADSARPNVAVTAAVAALANNQTCHRRLER